MASLGRVMRNAGLTTSTTLFDRTRQHICSGVSFDAPEASCVADCRTRTRGLAAGFGTHATFVSGWRTLNCSLCIRSLG